MPMECGDVKLDRELGELEGGCQPPGLEACLARRSLLQERKTAPRVGTSLGARCQTWLNCFT